MDRPSFLKVRPGDAVLCEKDQIGKVLTFVGGSRDPDATSLFQIANVDFVEICWINGGEVTDIVSEYRTTKKAFYFLRANSIEKTSAAITNKNPPPPRNSNNYKVI